MAPTTFRRLMFGLTAGLAALVLAVVLIDTDGEPTTLPPPVRSIFPLPNDVVVRQTAVEVSLPVGYELSLTVDGIRVPPDEIGRIPEVGSFRWQPGPGQVIEQWIPGEHTVQIAWDGVDGGTPDQGTFTWRFRVG